MDSVLCEERMDVALCTNIVELNPVVALPGGTPNWVFLRMCCSMERPILECPQPHSIRCCLVQQPMHRYAGDVLLLVRSFYGRF